MLPNGPPEIAQTFGGTGQCLSDSTPDNRYNYILLSSLYWKELNKEVPQMYKLVILKTMYTLCGHLIWLHLK